MTTILSADGQIEIPETFRKADALKAGQRCEIERVGHGEYHVWVDETGSAPQPKTGLVDLLLGCPVKDFFEPMDRTATMDDLDPLRYE